MSQDTKCSKCLVVLSNSNWSLCSQKNKRLSCSDCLKKQNQEWANKNKEKLRLKHKEYYYKNKEKRLESSKKYIANNREKHNLLKRKHTNKRRALLLKRLPLWANLDHISTFYSNCPKGYHVDHIIPLQGDNVSGLHVENNLQYLPATENLSKGNKYNVG